MESEQYPKPSRDEQEDFIHQIIRARGQNPVAPDMQRCAERFLLGLTDLASGSGADVLIDWEPNDRDGLIIERPMVFCAPSKDYLWPFFGRVHLGYSPCDKKAKPGELLRLIWTLTHQFQTPDLLADQILRELDMFLAPRGAAVLISCVQVADLIALPSVVGHPQKVLRAIGTLKTPEAREEFLHLA